MNAHTEPSPALRSPTPGISRRTALIRLGLAAGTAYIAPTILRIDRAKAVVISCPRGWHYDSRRHRCTYSDVRLKRDIVPLRKLDNGIGIYRYRYVWDDRLHVGVLAQEVAAIVPAAVVSGPGGYLQVDYAQLGLRPSLWPEGASESEIAAPIH